MRQIPLDLAFEAVPSFDNFVPGVNAAALQHLRTLGAAAAPVYLWGASGAGKTHLLRALAQRVQSAGGRVGSFDPAVELPWELDNTWGLVTLDRCDELGEEAQRAAFALFEEAAACAVPFAAAGRLPPVDLPLRDDLRTRLGWGHVFAVEALSEPETRAALRREADRRAVFLGDDLMDHLLTHHPRDLAHLVHLVERLDRYSLERSRPVSLTLLRHMLAQEEAEAQRGTATAAGPAPAATPLATPGRVGTAGATGAAP
ncbi:MAG: DnaA regulatory inactivator Hda [Rubrivivax sp.]|nr:DnaA regulatory inactivator Hda [Rubrivivax sp.]